MHIKFLTQGCYNYSTGATAASHCRNSEMIQGNETTKAENLVPLKAVIKCQCSAEDGGGDSGYIIPWQSLRLKQHNDPSCPVQGHRLGLWGLDLCDRGAAQRHRGRHGGSPAPRSTWRAAMGLFGDVVLCASISSTAWRGRQWKTPRNIQFKDNYSIHILFPALISHSISFSLLP